MAISYQRKLGDGTIVIDSGTSNVGIGTNDPQRELHIKGDTWAELRLDGQTFASGHGATLEFYSEGTALADIYASTDKHLYFRTNGTNERMRITSGGSVGIGTTNPPRKLSVETNDTATYSASVNASELSIARKNSSNTAGQVAAISLNATGWSGQTTGVVVLNAIARQGNFSNADFAIQNRVGGNFVETFRITTYGNVGIGTDTPDDNVNTGAYFKPDGGGRFLTVKDSSGSFIMLESSTTTNDDQIGGIYFNNTVGQADAHVHVAGIDAILHKHGTNDAFSGGDLRFFTKPSGSGVNGPRMVILENGDVGIGTTSPGDKLTVNGNISLENSGTPIFTLKDTGNSGGGGAAGIIRFKNNGGDAIGIGYTGNDTTTSDLLISTNAASTYGGYLGLDANAIIDPSSIILDPKTSVIINGDVVIGEHRIINLPSFNMGAGSVTDEYLVVCKQAPSGGGVVASGIQGRISFSRGSDGSFNNSHYIDINIQMSLDSGSVNTLDVTQFELYRDSSNPFFSQLEEIDIDGTKYVALKARSSGGGSVNHFYFEGSISDASDTNILSRVRASDSTVTVTDPQPTGFPITPYITKNQDGNVGIGTTSPGKKLEVAGSYKLGTNAYIEYGGVYPYTISTLNTASVGNLIFTAGAGSSGYESGITLQGSNTASDDGITFTAGSSTAMVIQVDGNVGIGTTSPTAPLDVVGVRAGRDWALSNRANIRLDSNGTGSPADILFGHTAAANQTSWSGVYWALSSRGTDDGNKFHFYRGGGNPGGNEAVAMTIASDLNVGIGTTSPNVPLEIHGADITTTSTTTATSVLRLVRDITDASFPNRKNSAVDFMLSRQQTVNNNLPYTRLDIRLAGTTDSSTPSLDVMSLLHNGNVGIGTTSPDSTLHVSSSSPIITISNSDTSIVDEQVIGQIDFKSLDGSTNMTNVFGSIRTEAEGTLDNGVNDGGKMVFSTFKQSTTLVDQMVIDRDGNVGIGGSPASVTHGPHLDIVGNRGTLTVGTGYFEDNGTTNFLNGARPLAFGYAGTEHMRVNSNGNVGIGNTSPGNRLRIDAAAGQATTLANSITNAAVYINSDTGNGSNNIRIGESGSGSYFLQASNSAGTTPYAINLNPFGGNVGIGTASPNSKLHVSGSIKAEGNGTDQYFFEGVRTGVGTTIRIYDNANTAYIDSYNNMAFRANQNGGSGGNFRFTGGNVGIGTTTANTLLSIDGQADNGVSIQGIGTTATRGFFGLDASGDGYFYLVNGGTFTKNIQLSSDLNVDNYIMGDLGIGTNSASNKLDVRGLSRLNALSLRGGTDNYAHLSRFSWRDTNSSSSGTTWKKVCGVSIGAGNYSALSMEVVHYYPGSNHGNSASLSKHYYSISFRRSSGTQDNQDNAIVYGRDANFIRVVRTALGEFELQARANGSHLSYSVDITQTGGNSDAITMVENSSTNGNTTGTIYTAVSSSNTAVNLPGSLGAGSNVYLNHSGHSFLNGGNVGIGTTTPDAPLTVHSSTDPEIRFGYSSTQDHRIQWDSSKVFIHADPENANASSAIALYVDGGAKLYIPDSGNVGIGTTGPQDKLHVVGTIRGDLKLEGGYTSGTTDVGKLTFGYTPRGGDTNNKNIAYITAFNTTTDSTSGGYLTIGTRATNGSMGEHIRITAAGTIGIGTNNPSYKLTVDNDAANTNNPALYVKNPNSSTAAVIAEFVGDSDSIQIKNIGTGDYAIYNSQQSNGIALFDGTGGVEIKYAGTTTLESDSTGGIKVTGQLSATGDVVAYSSDKRLKENIKPIENAVDKIKQLKGVTFDWNEKSEELGFEPSTKTNDVGVIAQDVEAVFPQLVHLAPFDIGSDEEGKATSKTGEDYKTVNYARLTAVLIEAVKEQQQQIDELKAKLDGITK